VTHNDPKINNVLFDKDTLKFKCVVDLDTVMPGTILYDFGDGLRSLFTGDNECSKDLSKLKVNFKMYELYLNGYAKKMKKTLTKKEIELLPFSIFLMAIELAIRFLDDFLRGDVYFGIHNEDDNLTRARTQLTLAKDIYNNLDLLNKKTKEIIDSIN
jgi:Ser/Thr protein kinase RdoA (MazF antagonist)